MPSSGMMSAETEHGKQSKFVVERFKNGSLTLTVIRRENVPHLSYIEDKNKLYD